MGKRGRLCRRGTWIEGGGSPRAHPKEYTDRGMGRSRVHLLQDRPPNELFTTWGSCVCWFHQAFIGFSLVSKVPGRQDSRVGSGVCAAG